MSQNGYGRFVEAKLACLQTLWRTQEKSGTKLVCATNFQMVMLCRLVCAPVCVCECVVCLSEIVFVSSCVLGLCVCVCVCKSVCSETPFEAQAFSKASSLSNPSPSLGQQHASWASSSSTGRPGRKGQRRRWKRGGQRRSGQRRSGQRRSGQRRSGQHGTWKRGTSRPAGSRRLFVPHVFFSGELGECQL